ncbi:bpX6 domain-containing protein [Kitasatospora sp. Root107]|uniref:bpX6 domain-containing protein n=1 Tax=Kitasatospora sp. Root107 TaxID=1736424 RepID=UPI00138F3765|nr:bpX6 domain-containing protein [Kitasatospora sp. Root107]
MTSTQNAAFRAAVTATGFVLDVPVIGAAEAAERVLESWQDGAELRRLPDGRWLFTLAAPMEIRADRAPGLPVLRTGTGGSAAVGADASLATSGQLALASGGLTTTQAIAELAELNPSDWLDLSGLTVHRPRPVGAAAPEAAPVVEALPEKPRPDLRAAARIAPPTKRTLRLAEDTPAGSRRRLSRFLPRLPRLPQLRPPTWLRPLAVGTAVALLPGLLLIVGSTRVSLEHDPRIWVLGLALAVVVAVGRSRRLAREAAAATAAAASGTGTGTGSAAGAASGRAKPRRPLFGPLLARLTMRTAGNLIRGRHARYLRELTRAFEQRQWEDALRDAIRLADERSAGQESWLTLGLPRRHTGELRATPLAGESGASSPLSGPSVHQHLAALYRSAAEDLERAGRIDEAAFVLADLLDAPAEAVALLARHGRPAAAAELAEGRELAADLVVRLWWQAGERERAVRTAHRRSVFASAVERLSTEDPDAARELRAAWAAHCRDSGDRLGAAEVLWPDESLRPSAAADLREAVALGGATRSRALPYLLALGAGDATRALALAVLDSEGDPTVTGRSVLAAGLARLPAADPAVDRELATAAARSVVRDGGSAAAGPGRPAGGGRPRQAAPPGPARRARRRRAQRRRPPRHAASAGRGGARLRRRPGRLRPGGRPPAHLRRPHQGPMGRARRPVGARRPRRLRTPGGGLRTDQGDQPTGSRHPHRPPLDDAARPADRRLLRRPPLGHGRRRRHPGTGHSRPRAHRGLARTRRHRAAGGHRRPYSRQVFGRRGLAAARRLTAGRALALGPARLGAALPDGAGRVPPRPLRAARECGAAHRRTAGG